LSLQELLHDAPRLIMFGGKGGVGKTTCACATAFRLSEEGFKTLLISSDPTPSLSDIFTKHIGNVIVPVENSDNLFAVEIDRETVVKRWKSKFGEEVYRVASSLLPVGRGVIDYVAEAPGIDEEFLLDYILELFEKHIYDKIVWDTAPAGHTLRLLQYPEIFTSHLDVVGKTYYRIAVQYQKVKRASTRSRGKAEPRSLLETLERWKALARRVIHLITDADTTEFELVTIPEAMGVKLTMRLLSIFKEYGIPITHLIVNNVINRHDAAQCPFLERKRRMQLNHLSYLGRHLKSQLEIIETPLLPTEIQGTESIRQFARYLFPAKTS